MSDFFDELNNSFNKEFIKDFLKYVKDPNNKISDNLIKFLNDSKISINEILVNFIDKKDNLQSDSEYKNIDENLSVSPLQKKDYDDLLIRLQMIQENMKHMENYLTNK